ncbi:hypothetical protein LN736_06235 [Clostridium sp. WLY-B-L2]|uniref:Pathogenicity island protein n=1 Tax=Clostridium aromativorans TaxID=2836848 RepID=A0ABS8N5W1_9CLOT|nr:winged-helix domain-containing protein [Clostridium aromativorans]MCC9294455.1 hypothetical protein [Clostridium aromativorans]
MIERKNFDDDTYIRGLSKLEKDGKKYINSRDFAEMAGLNHEQLYWLISNIIDSYEELNDPEYFIDSDYLGYNNASYLCYGIAPKGAEILITEIKNNLDVLLNNVYGRLEDEGKEDE